MTCYGIETHINGQYRCFPIYEVVTIHWPPPPPNGDPLSHVVRDLAILRTLNTGIAHIGDRGARESLGQALHSAARSMKLPDGVKLGDGLFQQTRELEHA